MEKSELINRITNIVKEYGGFSVGEIEEETGGVVVSELGKFVGIAEYFDTDPALVRIIALIFIVVTGIIPGLIIYFIIAKAIMPEAKNGKSK